MAKQILTKIKDELQKMNQSTDVTYTQTYIPWNKDRGFSVECTRCKSRFEVEYDDYDYCPNCGQAIDCGEEEFQAPYRPDKCHGCFGAANNDCERCMDGNG